MIKKRTLRLLWAFYKNFILLAIILTAICVYVFSIYLLDILTVILWFKMITSAIIVYYINGYKKSDFYYYQNHGLSKLLLWTCTLAADFLIFAILLFITAIVL